MGSVKITIDGPESEVGAGQTIIEAAFKQGIDIPHFCWHPRLTVSGNCRMCLVEVEKLPKLVIACSTTVADGMVVHTKSPQVVNAQEAVLESSSESPQRSSRHSRVIGSWTFML